jgi:hypothetical protein
MTTRTDAYAPTDASYVLLAEFGITHVAAAGFLQLRQASGTYPVLFSWYWLCASGALLLLAASLAYARLQHALLDVALRAGMHFHLAVLVVLLSFLALAAGGPRCPTASLLLGARAQESETWLWPLGTVIGVTLATVQFLLCFFVASSSSPAAARSGSAAEQAYRTCLTVVALGTFTQLALHVQLQHLCVPVFALASPALGDDCASESIDALASLGAGGVLAKYWTCFAKTAGLLAVDLLAVAADVLRLLWSLALQFMPASLGVSASGQRPGHHAWQASLCRAWMVLACIWPVGVVWWYTWHEHTSECMLVFRTYNIVAASIFSASAAWLFAHKLGNIGGAHSPPPVIKQQYKNTACFIGTQQTRQTSTRLHKKTN